VKGIKIKKKEKKNKNKGTSLFTVDCIQYKMMKSEEQK
jgi:hypothetical protein